MAVDDESDSFSRQPIIFVALPIIAIIIAALVTTVMIRRRRRRLSGLPVYGQTPAVIVQIRPLGQRQRTRRATRNRGAAWGQTRSQEGLNELGEAPPPYEGRKSGGGGTGDPQRRHEDGSSSRNIRGEDVNVDADARAYSPPVEWANTAAMPPDYIAEPARAVTRPLS
jgi:hypothetical protein